MFSSLSLHLPGSFWGAKRCGNNASMRTFQSPATTGKPRRVHELRNTQIVQVPQALGQRIECLEGSVWVTLDGDARDVVLHRGQSFLVDRPQRTLIQALEAARVVWAPEPQTSRQGGGTA